MRDDEPSPDPKNQKSALLQTLQRLTDGRAADPEIARHFLLAHALAGSDATVRDGIAKAVVYELRARAGPQDRLIGRHKLGRRDVGHPAGSTLMRSHSRLGRFSLNKLFDTGSNTIVYRPQNTIVYRIK